jgi:hypothetical protein
MLGRKMPEGWYVAPIVEGERLLDKLLADDFARRYQYDVNSSFGKASGCHALVCRKDESGRWQYVDPSVPTCPEVPSEAEALRKEVSDVTDLAGRLAIGKAKALLAEKRAAERAERAERELGAAMDAVRAARACLKSPTGENQDALRASLEKVKGA